MEKFLDMAKCWKTGLGGLWSMTFDKKKFHKDSPWQEFPNDLSKSCSQHSGNFLVFLNMQNSISPTFSRLIFCICYHYNSACSYGWISISTNKKYMPIDEPIDIYPTFGRHLKVVFQTAYWHLDKSLQTLSHKGDFIFFVRIGEWDIQNVRNIILTQPC